MVSSLRKSLDAVVFDLDGTLIDSAPDLAACINRLMVREGRREVTLGEVKMMIGDGAPKLVERSFAATGAEIEAARRDALNASFLGDIEANGAVLTRPYPGVAETLQHLTEAGLKLGICTNKPRAATLAVLRQLGLADHFPIVVGGDEMNGIRKPDPRHLLATIEHLGAEPGRVMMVGDNGNDVQAARAAQVPVVVVAFGYARMPVEDLGADAVIEHFNQLPEALRRLS